MALGRRSATLLGLLAGIASTFLVDDTVDPTTYYKATNTLVVDRGIVDHRLRRPRPNLPQTALFVRSAEVVQRRGREARASTRGAVSDQVTAVPLPELSAIDVTAIPTDPEQAVDLADTTAAVLSDYVAGDQQRQYTQPSATTSSGGSTSSTAQRDALQAQVVANAATPASRPSSSRSLNQFRVTNEQLQRLASRASPPAASRRCRAPPRSRSTPGPTTPASPPTATPSATASVAGSPDRFGSVAIDFSETDLSAPAPSRSAIRVVIGTSTGLVLGIITAFVVEAWDDRLRRRQRDRVGHRPPGHRRGPHPRQGPARPDTTWSSSTPRLPGRRELPVGPVGDPLPAATGAASM